VRRRPLRSSRRLSVVRRLAFFFAYLAGRVTTAFVFNSLQTASDAYLSTLLSFRTAAVIMSSIYLVGMVALLWAPETKSQPLPED
jgi:hypothetical protein